MEIMVGPLQSCRDVMWQYSCHPVWQRSEVPSEDQAHQDALSLRARRHKDKGGCHQVHTH